TTFNTARISRLGRPRVLLWLAPEPECNGLIMGLPKRTATLPPRRVAFTGSCSRLDRDAFHEGKISTDAVYCLRNSGGRHNGRGGKPGPATWFRNNMRHPGWSDRTLAVGT